MAPQGSAAAQRRRRPKSRAAGHPDERSSGKQYHLKAINRALDVLECFTDSRPVLNLKEIAQLIRLPESSLFRILLTLESRGYLQQNADGAYQLPRKLLYGRSQERAERVIQCARPHLHALASRFDETASLAYLFGDRIEALDTVETFQEIRMSNKPGRVLPPHCSSLGKAITAFQERPLMDTILEVYGLYRRTEKTVVDRHSLLQEFERIRTQGYAVDKQESVTGGICTGAPIRGAGGKVIAAISVSVPVVRMTPERQRDVAAAVVEAANLISADLTKASGAS